MITSNIVHFGRLLRHAGLPVGPDRVLRAIEVLDRINLQNRADVQAALRSVLISRHEHASIFDSAFDLYWQTGDLLRPSVADLLQADSAPDQPPRKTQPARLSEAFQALAHQAEAHAEHDASESFSAQEKLHTQDFASMTRDEFAQAARVVRQLNLPIKPVISRRYRPAARGQLDLRQTRRQMVRSPDTLQPGYRTRVLEEPPLVVLLDVSGSMERYARMFLHFAHGLTRRYQRVSTLVFGTRLTNISRHLRDRDVDIALAGAAMQVHDWHGGTRIGASLGAFNRQWARRLLSRNATLMLVTDGLDRDDSDTLARESALLRRFARQIIWLNPLLRYDGFEPRAAGIRTLLPHADHFLPVHNIDSLAQLGQQLSSARRFRRPGNQPSG